MSYELSPRQIVARYMASEVEFIQRLQIESCIRKALVQRAQIRWRFVFIVLPQERPQIQCDDCERTGQLRCLGSRI